MCKDPIWSFICIDCLAKDIKQWLPHQLSFSFFQEFHNPFSVHFNNIYAGFEYCVNCKSLTQASICPYCYINEVFLWLKNKNPGLAGKIVKMIPSDFLVTELDGCRHKDDVYPITESKYKKTDIGICESCESYSDELALIDGKWLCKQCVDLR
jgi:hypothetical protein